MRVEFVAYIRGPIGESSDDVMLIRVEECPCVPDVGVHVSRGDWSTTVESLWLNLDGDQQVVAFCGHCRTHDDEEREQAVVEHLECGWKMVKRAT